VLPNIDRIIALAICAGDAVFAVSDAVRGVA
jgi:hypothetical protein